MSSPLTCVVVCWIWTQYVAGFLQPPIVPPRELKTGLMSERSIEPSACAKARSDFGCDVCRAVAGDFVLHSPLGGFFDKTNPQFFLQVWLSIRHSGPRCNSGTDELCDCVRSVCAAHVPVASRERHLRFQRGASCSMLASPVALTSSVFWGRLGASCRL